MATPKKVGFGSCRYVYINICIYIYAYCIWVFRFKPREKWIEMGIRWYVGENQGSEMSSHVPPIFL